jgi:uncharacterized membrane protein
MLERSVLGLTFAAAIGCGLVAGVFLAFSSFVMAALARLPTDQGVAAMQAINVTVLNSVFIMTFLATGIACCALAGISLVGWSHVNRPLVVLACLVYLAGSIGTTLMFNVPLNDALAALSPTTREAVEFWPEFLTAWNRWNNVRTLASAVASALLTFSLIHG